MKCNWIQRQILKIASNIIDKHKQCKTVEEISPFVLDMLTIAHSFDEFVQHVASFEVGKSENQVLIPIQEQKYKS